MTFGKYKRLLVVVSLPLLLLGYFLSEFVVPYPKFARLVCQNWGTMENCRNVGEPGETFYDHTKKQSPAWFQVNGGPIDDTHVYYVVEGDARLLGRVTIDEVVPYLDIMNSQEPAMMEKLKGREAMMRLGIEKGQRSVDLGSEIFLYCHTLQLDMKPRPYIKNPGPYLADCVADNWGGLIAFTPGQEAGQTLALLRNAISEEVDKKERDYLMHRIVICLYPLALFLILSGSVWVMRRAAAYVRAG